MVQDAFIKAFEKLADLKDPEAFRPWLRHIVRSTALDALRRRRPVRSLDAHDGFDVEGEQAPPETDLDQAELHAAIQQHIARLPEAQREVIAMKYLEGLSYEEIAERTGATLSSIESRLHRARQRLKQSLGRLRRAHGLGGR